MLEFCKRFLSDESGQDLAEYALLLVLIGVALVGILTLFQGQIRAVFTAANTALTPVATP